MTRSLFLLRHGKSSWAEPGVDDHDRALKRRGVRAAKTVGRVLRAADAVPERLLSSSARRAHDTAELARVAGHWGAPLEVHDALYLGSVEALLGLVRGSDGALRRVMVVGHEPMLSSTLRALSGGASVAFPTAALARIDFDGDWCDLAPGTGQLAWLATPALLQAALPDR